MHGAMLSLVLLVTCLWGSGNARGLVINELSSKFHLSRGEGGHVQPKEESSFPSSASLLTIASPSRGWQCRCGIRNTATRIVGGFETTVHEYPWQVALTATYDRMPYCGGSIISSQWILTAAHCVNRYITQATVAVIGEHNWRTTGETSATKRLRISKAIKHENYDKHSLDNDIALLKVAEPIVFPSDNKIAPVCLPTPGNLYDNVEATITGWGTLRTYGSQPEKLNEVTVSTMTNDACKATDYRSWEITDNMICAGDKKGGKDSCQGDSGGPMFTPGSSGAMEQIGIVSWGEGCGLQGYPGVSTRLGNYISWIESKIDESAGC